MLILLETLQRFAQRRRRAGAGGIWTGIAFATFLMRLPQAARQRRPRCARRCSRASRS